MEVEHKERLLLVFGLNKGCGSSLNWYCYNSEKIQKVCRKLGIKANFIVSATKEKRIEKIRNLQIWQELGFFVAIFLFYCTFIVVLIGLLPFLLWSTLILLLVGCCSLYFMLLNYYFITFFDFLFSCLEFILNW